MILYTSTNYIYNIYRHAGCLLGAADLRLPHLRLVLVPLQCCMNTIQYKTIIQNTTHNNIITPPACRSSRSWWCCRWSWARGRAWWRWRRSRSRCRESRCRHTLCCSYSPRICSAAQPVHSFISILYLAYCV